MGSGLHINTESTFKITNYIGDILNADWQSLDECDMIDPSSCSNKYLFIHVQMVSKKKQQTVLISSLYKLSPLS